MLPDFICIGPGRSGTSWLYEILREHPDICLAKDTKETNYFNTYYEKGIHWYQKFFSYCNPENIKGEISNLYIAYPEVRERIRKDLPDVKLIICLRNPYDKIKSGYNFERRKGVIKTGFNEALKEHEYLMDGCRLHQLVEPYTESFDRKNIFFLMFNDIKLKPLEASKQIFQFLEVDASFIPANATKKVNPSIEPKFFFVAKIAKSSAVILRVLGMYKLLTFLKRSEFVKSLFFKKKSIDSVTFNEETKRVLEREIQPEIDKLSKLLNKDFSMWTLN